MVNKLSLTELRDLLLAWRKPVYILSHPSPDGDSIGSTVGLYYLLTARGVKVMPILPDPVPGTYDFLLEDVPLLKPPLDLTDKNVIVLDCGGSQRLEQMGQSLTGAAQVINIDHHWGNDYFGDINYVDANAAAVGNIIHDIFVHTSPYPEQAAQALFTAVYTDTGRFSYSNTGPDTLEAASQMVEKGAQPWLVFNNLYQRRSINYYGFLAAALAKIKILFDDKVAVLALDHELLRLHGIEDWELEEINDYPRSLDGVMLAAVLRETQNGVKLSLRSKGAVDVSRIAKDFGGGGHHNAAGASFNLPLAQAQRELHQRLKEEFQSDD